MNLTISLHEFLELITYNQLFDYVQVPNSIGDSIQKCMDDNDPEKHFTTKTNIFLKPCHIERLGHACVIWYPYGSWTAELTRRSAFEAALMEAAKNPRVSLKLYKKDSIENDIQPHTDLQKQLIDATMKNDTSLIAYLLQQIAEDKT